MQKYERIRQTRRENNETQKQVAEALQIKQAQYQRYESGETAIPVNYLIDFCKHYHVSADYILGLSDEK